MIELREVSKDYDGHLALHRTNLTIPEGQTTVLIGPSGCGKSTLLRLIMGLIEPTSGDVLIDGQPLTASNALEMRHRMGYVVQDGGLFPHLTAEGNVLLLARFLGDDAKPSTASDTKSWQQERLRELCSLTKFPEDALRRHPGELSGGQRQRVGLMRALMLDPKFLLMDEPLAALDPMIRSSLQTDLKDIFQRLRKTVVFVTHDMAEAAYLGDRIVLLNEGWIVQQGTLDDLRKRPSDPFVTDFINAQRSLVQL